MTLDMDRVAPSALRVVCVDFDLTLVAWGALDTIPEPLPGAVDAVQRLQRSGYEVVVLTSRASPTWWADHCRGTEMDPEAFGAVQVYIVMRALTRAGLHGLRVTSEKIPALAYIDDRAVAFSGDWDAALAHVLEAS